MEQFNLDKYNALIAEGKKPRIVTRDGRNVRILCTDLMHKEGCIAAAVSDEVDREFLCYYPESGLYYEGQEDNSNDLFFAPTKHEGWVVLEGYFTPFDTKEEAEHHKIILPPKDGRVVAHIEWEE